MKALLQLVDRHGQRHWIGGVAIEHLDCDRAAVGRTHQADDDLWPVGTVVAAVAILRQFAAASFEIAGGDIVEQQRAILDAGCCSSRQHDLAGMAARQQRLHRRAGLGQREGFGDDAA